MPEAPQPLWSVQLGAPATAPVVADGTLYAASVDRHQVHALDARTGERRWSFTAGGRVDVPPTIDRGFCLFGSRDGWVYCLRAADGHLVWRFRAAPTDRRIVAFDQLESVWPVYGAVLVKNGVAYACAGRHSLIDGGMIIYALDVATGKLLWTRRPAGAMLNDLPVLCAQGNVTIFSRRFDARTGAPVRGRGSSLRRNGTDLLDDWRPATLPVIHGGKTYGSGSAPRGKVYVPGRGMCWLSATARDGGIVRQWWRVDKLPIYARAMLLAGETLFVAGRPDEVDAQGGEIRAYAASDGSGISVLKLDCPPIFDGLAAAGRLYLTTTDGQVRCFGEK